MRPLFLALAHLIWGTDRKSTIFAGRYLSIVRFLANLLVPEARISVWGRHTEGFILEFNCLIDQIDNFNQLNHMKRVLAYIKIILLSAILPAFSVNAQTAGIGHAVQKRHITESYAMDTVLGLPEIKEDDAYIRKTTKGKRHLSSMIYRESDSLHPYYWVVVVGEDNGMSFVTRFTFYVYKNG
jgi:hypothetical protein